MTDVADRIRQGDRRELARAITRAESERPDHQAAVTDLLDELLPDTGEAIRIGVSGAPGVGKSTFIEALGSRLVDDHDIAVLAVDPSSSRSGGSILGDKTRMAELAVHPRAFIRPSPAGATLGGVARRTREAMLLCEAAGFDVILVETVGVGQSETAVADLVDLFLLLVAPGGGDELQGIKRGIMELADLVVVNKTDGALTSAAQHAAADYANALHLIRPKWSVWAPRVVTCSSTEGTGIDDVWQAVAELRSALTSAGILDRQRRDQATAWMWAEIDETLMGRLRGDPDVAQRIDELEPRVASGELSPASAARIVLDAFGGPRMPKP